MIGQKPILKSGVSHTYSSNCLSALPLISPFVSLYSTMSFFTSAIASFLCDLSACFYSSASAFLSACMSSNSFDPSTKNLQFLNKTPRCIVKFYRFKLTFPI